MALFKYLSACFLASCGIGLGAINVWNNAIAINGGDFVLNDLTALVAGLALLAALLSVSLGAVTRKSTVAGVLCVLAIAGCVFTSVGYTLGRVGSVADSGASEALSHNARIELVESEVRALTEKRDAEEANGGCGPQCRAIEKRLEAQRATLAGLGSRMVVDPAGERLEAVTGGWLTAAQYRTAHPVVTAATLELGVSLLLTIAGLFWPKHTAPRLAPVVGEMIDITPADPLVALLKRHPRGLTNDDVAAALSVTKSAASQRVSKLVDAGRISRQRVGREVQIKLLA